MTAERIRGMGELERRACFTPELHRGCRALVAADVVLHSGFFTLAVGLPSLDLHEIIAIKRTAIYLALEDKAPDTPYRPDFLD